MDGLAGRVPQGELHPALAALRPAAASVPAGLPALDRFSVGLERAGVAVVTAAGVATGWARRSAS